MINTDKELQYYQYVMVPGHIAVSDEPTLLCSVCGNGVVVTIWDKFKRTGGMAHCIFPKRGWGEGPTNYHASVAIPLLIKQLKEIGGASTHNLEAQLFGGGNLNGFSRRRAEKVVNSARRLLRKMSIPIVSEDTGGSLGRKVVFNTYSGDVVLLKTKKVRRSDWAPEYGLQIR